MVHAFFENVDSEMVVVPSRLWLLLTTPCLSRAAVWGAGFQYCGRGPCTSTVPERQGVTSDGLFCCRAAVCHATAKNHHGTQINFVTHDSLTAMRRRLDAVDAHMMPILWLPGPVSAEKGMRKQPRTKRDHKETKNV